MFEVVIDEVLKLNADNKHYKDDPINEYVNNVEGEDALVVSVDEVAGKDVDENVDVDLDVPVTDDVVVLNVGIEVILEDGVAKQGKIDVVDILGDVVCEDVDCVVNGNAEDEVEEDGGQVEDVTADGVCIVVVVILLDNDVVKVDEADILVDATIVVSLIAFVDDKLIHQHLDVVVVVASVDVLLMIKSDVYVVGVGHLGEVAVRLPPVDEMLNVEIEANDVGDDVSPLDAMKPAGSISRCTKNV